MTRLRRDLVREFVDTARAEGLRVGLYYSLMDWHHPEGARCVCDPQARRRFVDYTHGLIRELLTNYGKIDILWYDVSRPLTPEQWESGRMNRMVFELQPHIIVNDRNGLEGDFSTPEQKIESAKEGRAWETCMTLNDSWGLIVRIRSSQVRATAANDNCRFTGTKSFCSRFFSRVVGYAETKHVKQFEACTSGRGRVSGLAVVFFRDAGGGSHLRTLRSGW